MPGLEGGQGPVVGDFAQAGANAVVFGGGHEHLYVPDQQPFRGRGGVPLQARLGGHVQGARVVAEVLEGGACSRCEGIEAGAEHTHRPHTLQPRSQGLDPAPALDNEGFSPGLLAQFAPEDAEACVDILQGVEAIQHHQPNLGPPEQGQGLGAGETGGQHQVRSEAQHTLRVAVLDGGEPLRLNGHRTEPRILSDVAEGRDLARVRQGQQQFVHPHRLAHHALGLGRGERQGDHQHN